MSDLILDGTKIEWYKDRVEAWERGERITPITVDMALTTTCNMRCQFCYGQLQHNTNYKITKEHMTSFLNDCAEMGVKGVSLVSDGESSISPAYVHTIQHGRKLGLSMASGTNAYLLRTEMLQQILSCLAYLRINISAGERRRYNEIMGAHGDMYATVICNIAEAVSQKRKGYHDCTIGMQMVFLPAYEDQVIPLAKLALDLGVDYLVIKHCSDDELGTLGVEYDKYKAAYDTLRKAESMSNNQTRIVVKWSKICDGNNRTYKRCYAPPFILQISGTGLVAPCGMLFNDRYKWAHMGNITQQSFKSIVESDRYWEVMQRLASNRFDARTMCGSLCLQHGVNKWLSAYKSGECNLVEMNGQPPLHKEFI